MFSRLWQRNRNRPSSDLSAERADSHVPPEASSSGQSPPKRTQLTQIAQASVKLAEMGPRLAVLAASLEQQAGSQARHAATIAATMTRLAGDLENAVTELRASSGQMHQALSTVEKIADHTRILAINASIEAARAGEHGLAFAVVVEEVKQLSDRTGQTTELIHERMGEMEGSITRVAAVAGTKATDAAAANAYTVETVNQQVRGMADSAGLQLESAASVHAMGDQIRTMTEALLLAVGKFRFEVHARAQQSVESLLPALRACEGDRSRLESTLTRWLEAQPHFELAYLTDARGRQIIDNIGRKDGRVAADPAGFGREWSERPWYRDAFRSDEVCATDVYRSTATGDFCFTIARALRDEQGNMLGVFGSDVNFQRLVTG